MPVRDLTFTFLGTGTSAGVPIIACDCRVCTSDDPRDKRTRCGACVKFTDSDDQPRTILIDTTPDLRVQALRQNLRRCDAIIFTHNHVDHTFGLDEVRRFNAVMKQPIDIYADAHTLATLKQTYRHIFDAQNNVNDSFVATLIPHVINPEVSFELFGLSITPLKLLHGRLPVLGYRIEEASNEGGGVCGGLGIEGGTILPLAYCTDVSSIPPETWPRLVGLETLVLDMLRIRHHPTHLTLDQAVTIATEVAAKATYFIHMTHDILHAEVDADLPVGMRLAFDGLRIA